MSDRKLTERAEETHDIVPAFNYMKKIIIDIDIILMDYENDLSPEEKRKLLAGKESVKAVLDKYNSQGEALELAVSNELIEPDMIEYVMKNRKYPEKASKTYEIFKQDMAKCFEIENEIAESIVIKIWQKATEKAGNLKLGDEFCSIVHSGHGEITLPGVKSYRQSEFDNTRYISCSMLTDKQMDMFNSKLGIEFWVEKNSFLTASSYDCVTRRTNKPSIYTLKKIENEYIEAGYSICREPITRLGTPKQIERECCKKAIDVNGELLKQYSTAKGGNIINEIVLDKTQARPKSIVLQTNGASFDFELYAKAKKMEALYGVPLKVINRSLYRKKLGLDPFGEDVKEDFYRQVKMYSNVEDFFTTNAVTMMCFAGKTPAEIIGFLNSFYIDVVEGGNFEENVKKHIKMTLDKMISYEREAQRRENLSTNKAQRINHDI